MAQQTQSRTMLEKKNQFSWRGQLPPLPPPPLCTALVTCLASRLFQLVQLMNLYHAVELFRNRIGGNGVQVKTENKNLTSCAHVLHKTLNLVISRCCFVEDCEEMYQNLSCTCRAFVFLIKSYCFVMFSFPSP